METSIFMQGYGVLGYSMTVVLAIVWTSIALAYYKADRGKRQWLMLIVSTILYAVLFSYLVLVSIEPPWLNRFVMQPAMRTVALGAAVTLGLFTGMVLKREAKEHGTSKETNHEHVRGGNIAG